MSTVLWSIDHVYADTQSKAVSQCFWKCSCEDNEFAGGVTLAPADTSSSGFIAYEELTQEIVLQWIFDLLGNEKAIIETQVCKPVTSPPEAPLFKGVPWAS